MPASSTLNKYAAEGIFRTAAKKLLRFINKETSSLEEYFRKIGEDQLTLIANKLKKDGISSNVYREKVPALLAKLFTEECERVASRKNNRKQKNTNNSEDKFVFEKTVSDETFSTVFNHVDASQISAIKNRNAIHAFVLKPELVPFRYAELKNLIETNLTNYALARGGSRDAVVGLRTARTLRKYVKNGNTTNLLGELLNYIFLEHAEKALKIYTRAEVFEKSRSIDSERLYLRRGDGKTQLILGASQVNDSLQIAVSNAVTRLSNLMSNYTNGAVLLADFFDTSIMQSQFGDEDGKKIIDLLDPNKAEIEEIASYGLFIGYKFKTDEDIFDCSPDDSKRICQQAVLDDLSQAVSQLNEAIKKYHWQRSPFYVYLLPFNNAEKDSQKIMEDLIGG